MTGLAASAPQAGALVVIARDLSSEELAEAMTQLQSST
ncbi:hypothetical protein D558_0260 [Bordetella holmesii 44057]|nr:hypothetical protein D558_0260 [Bordetella holmesii 44057]